MKQSAERLAASANVEAAEIITHCVDALKGKTKPLESGERKRATAFRGNVV